MHYTLFNGLSSENLFAIIYNKSVVRQKIQFNKLDSNVSWFYTIRNKKRCLKLVLNNKYTALHLS